MEKGFKTLELIGDLDDKYIYEASRPWKKQHRFFHIQRSWKTAVAGIILLIMVGCTLRYQEDVKAALQRVTSWIGQALGIKNGSPIIRWIWYVSASACMESVPPVRKGCVTSAH